MQGELNRLISLHSWRIDVYIRRKLYFGYQADPATRYDPAIRLRKGKLEMRRIDILAHFRAQLWEQLCDNIIRRQSIRILRREILFANNPACVYVEDSGISHP